MPACGHCKFAKSVPEDLRMRVCKHGPPQIVVLPAPGGVAMQTMFPNVPADMEAPEGCFAPAAPAILLT